MTKRAGLSARTRTLQAALTVSSPETPAVGEAPAKPPAPDKPVVTSVRLSSAMHERLRRIAFERRVSLHTLLIEGVETVLSRHDGKTH